MLDEIPHRGPDGRRVFAEEGVCLGHLRLAIIDLSDAGLQPMTDEDGRVQIVGPWPADGLRLVDA